MIRDQFIETVECVYQQLLDGATTIGCDMPPTTEYDYHDGYDEQETLALATVAAQLMLSYVDTDPPKYFEPQPVSGEIINSATLA